MKRIVLILIGALILGGCSTGSGSITEGEAAETPTASIQMNFTLLRAIPANVTTLEISGLDLSGNRAFGPVTSAKAAQVEVSGVPLQVRTLRILYFQGAILVGLGETAVLLSSNGKNVVNDPDFANVTVTNLAILPSGPITINSTQQLAVTATLSNLEQFAVTEDATYTSSAPAVATVDSNGLVTAVATGTTTITATYSGQTANLVVNVP